MPDVHVTLTQSEALVLFEVLLRYAEKTVLGTNDQSEQVALLSLRDLLQNVLPEVLHRNYQPLLAAAQDELRDSDGTNAQYELELGRIALWLDPSDLAFLVNEWRKMPQSAVASECNQWGDIAFRAMSALHKAGIKYKAEDPTMVYQLVTRESNSDGEGSINLSS